MATKPVKWLQIDEKGLQVALAQAKKGYDEGGIPIGSAILIPKDQAGPPEQDGSNAYHLLGQGHNQRIQKLSPILHGEMAALEDAGRLKPEIYRKATIYTTLSPCSMCTGAILLYKVPRVVIGENQTYLGSEDLLRSHGVEVIVVDSHDCKELMQQFIRERPKDWDEDIGGGGSTIVT
ncbi:cytosine deaminase [Crepidotus variabilis]|uniref:Cytosine deaminase n=1 Tax=Crepidotus variabilis TaxID=179855 RepID=A0A9P6EEC2_9AGAR|nr:cytosine deaminase [Crepidotus variabilis]